MKEAKEERGKMLAQVARVGFFPLLLLQFFFCPGQRPVAPVTGWVATVDSASQKIVLCWRPSADSTTMGYHICTGDTCMDYDTVYGRFDTSYICEDHSALERHSYRLHVFDSSYNVSELTPFFGNVVLDAEVPRCGSSVHARWTTYEGIPPRTDNMTGTENYILQTRLEPLDDTLRNRLTTTPSSPREWSFDIPDAVTRVWLRVMVHRDDGFCSYSNIVVVERQTIDSASAVDISAIEFDSIHAVINLTCDVDTAFEYNLYRSIDGRPWRLLETLSPRRTPYLYSDRDVNIYDSLYCYRLEVFDACGLNPRYSGTACAVLPPPVAPAVAVPNAIIAGDAENGVFQPRFKGYKGDLYELAIYDRHGLLVFSTSDPDTPWRPDAAVAQGAYAYVLRMRFNNNKIQTYTGTITVIR